MTVQFGMLNNYLDIKVALGMIYVNKLRVILTKNPSFYKLKKNSTIKIKYYETYYGTTEKARIPDNYRL
ncbi:MAG: hypothetical protein JWM20_876 [Patescibacteria group bacterium]|nr:hypothetical protein [Patescibacteria group bacterium]